MGAYIIGAFLGRSKTWVKLPRPKVNKSKTQPSCHFPMWIWCGLRAKTMGGSNKKSIDVAYIPYAHVRDFLEDKQGELCALVEWNIHKNMLAQKDVKNFTIQHHLGHTWYVSHEGIAFICLLFTTTIVIHKIGMQHFFN